MKMTKGAVPDIKGRGDNARRQGHDVTDFLWRIGEKDLKELAFSDGRLVVNAHLENIWTEILPWFHLQ
ncbi:hypothetical protein XENTR_v10000268 [Xenopus tropicalis]|nr:hypothetical protein XENTR_v10000268 [Xenopus tropicalis]